jgi:hypothetical protein
MKGGKSVRWLGKLTNVVNFAKSGAEIRAFRKEKGQSTSLPGEEYYFQKGVTYSYLDPKRMTARLLPAGFVFDIHGSSAFSPNPEMLLALLNSDLGTYFRFLINPTIALQIGDLKRFPMPSGALSENAKRWVDACLSSQKRVEEAQETSSYFVNPSRSSNESLDLYEREINSEIFRLFGFSYEEIQKFYFEIEQSTSALSEDQDSVQCESPSDSDAEHINDNHGLAWINYAIGSVLGRFEIGKPGALGCGDFPDAKIEEIRKLIDPDGIMPCEEGHPQDLASRVFTCLEQMLGVTEAIDAIRAAFETDGEPITALRGWLDRFTGQPDDSFWKYHHQLYRKRPIYWPFQSPEKKFTIWVFHEKVGPNTLHTVKQLSDEQLNLTERRITDLRLAPTSKAADRELQKLLTKSDDLREFSKRLQAHIESGYVSCIDDGVLLNAAPLHDLFPSWPDTKKAWVELEAGEYEWAHQAMRYWPGRVTDACRTNRSLAIAHGLERLCPPEPPKEAKARGRKKSAKTENPLL